MRPRKPIFPPLPTRSTTNTSTTTSSSQPKPSSTSAAALDYDAILRSPSWRRFRSKYLAVGVAVIAASGALFGAQLKTVWQDWRENEVRRKVAAVQGGQGDSGGASGERLLEEGTPERKEGREVLVERQQQVSLADLNRSIASLETVRGQLVRRRQQEEVKLRHLRERMGRKRGLEERREEVASAAAAAAAAAASASGEGGVVGR